MLVVPAVIMVEGVHHGSGGPVYHNPAVFSQYAHLWNGVPIPIDHPRAADGTPISANAPGLQYQMVGTVENAHYDSEDQKLKAEMWLDMLNLMTTSPDAYQMVMNGQPLQLSHGGRDVVTREPGDWQGERYTGFVSTYAPDHVALLPGMEGACNFDDGCGIRTNSRGGENSMSEVITLSKRIVENATPWRVNNIVTQITVNATGFIDIANNLQRVLDGMDNYPQIHYLEELYESHLIYRVNNYDTKETQYFRQAYTVNSENAVSLEGDPVRVYKEVSYLDAPTTNKSEIETNKVEDKEEDTEDKTELQNNSEEVPVMANCSCEKADALIKLNIGYTEADKERIEQMPEDFVDRLIANAESLKTNEEEDDDSSTQEDSQEDQQTQQTADEDSDEDMSVNEAIKVITDKVGPEGIVKLLPEDVQASITYNRRKAEEAKKKLVIYLDDKTKQTVYDKKQLEAMSIEDLEKTAKLVGYSGEEEKNDYSPLGNVISNKAEESGGDSDFLFPGKKLDS